MTTPRIGYGAMRLTGPGHWGDYPDREGGVKLLRQVADAGVTLIDTADVYGPHTNELLIRDALHPYPEHLRIATKGGFVRSGPEISTIAALGHRQYLRQSAKLSARRLGVERIDLYYLHSGWARDASFEEQVGTLAELREEGVIGDIGLSNVTLEQLRTAQAIVEVAAVTAHYNVADRHEQPLLDAATEAGAIFVPWQPVSLAVPGAPTDTAGPDAVRRVLEPIAARHGATVSQVALAWLLGRSPAVLPIPGTTSIAHVRENLAAADLVLSPEEHTAIT
ncbi:aldo/keto reductase [Amycolatopsis sp. WQ 127309]|uniref:aldo/keto reductase n=1 Tax=Amycolatopsis sp. WQ 127309 TaxID=2932773 RepID=UPI001FF0E1EC|nr:aldo/keto reductase [Amycolatopsis sp. WQ 127309]UOZ07175.1 aldo/keto reductase [Amycolatopsis sp. WQ 127309]